MGKIEISLEGLGGVGWSEVGREEELLPSGVGVVLSTGNQFKRRVAESSLGHAVDVIDFDIDEEELRTDIPSGVPVYLYPVVLSILKGQKTIELMEETDQVVVSADTVVLVGDKAFNRARDEEGLRAWKEALKEEREIEYLAGVSAIGPEIGVGISYLKAPIKDFSEADWSRFIDGMGEGIWKMGINIMTVEFRELLDESGDISWGYGTHDGRNLVRNEAGRASILELKSEQFDSLVDFKGEIRPFMSGFEKHLLSSVIKVAGGF